MSLTSCRQRGAAGAPLQRRLRIQRLSPGAARLAERKGARGGCTKAFARATRGTWGASRGIPMSATPLQHDWCAFEWRLINFLSRVTMNKFAGQEPEYDIDANAAHNTGVQMGSRLYNFSQIAWGR